MRIRPTAERLIRVCEGVREIAGTSGITFLDGYVTANFGKYKDIPADLQVKVDQLLKATPKSKDAKDALATKEDKYSAEVYLKIEGYTMAVWASMGEWRMGAPKQEGEAYQALITALKGV